MSLQNMETGQPAPAREQMEELTQQSRQEYENSLLKQALQEYSEQWTALKGEQNSFIQKQTKQINALTHTVAAQINMNELFRKDLENELNKLTSQLSEHLSEQFEKQFQRFEEAANQSEQQISEHTDKCITELSDLTARLKAKQQRSFTRKNVMFWVNIAAILSLVLMEVLRSFRII